MAIDGAAWLGFGGVVAGALLGYASSAAQESARRRHDQRRAAQLAEREDRIRFEDRRFHAYVAVIETANQVYAAVKYPAVVRPDPSDGAGRPPSREAEIPAAQLRATYAQFRTALSPAFLMTSSTRTRDGIAGLAHAVRELVRGAEKASWPGDGVLWPLYHGHRQALRAAEAAMREEFGLVADPSVQPESEPTG